MKVSIIYGILMTMTCAMTFISCKSGEDILGDPKSRLGEYISNSFAIKSASDKESLLKFLSGDARARLSSWSDEQFEQAFKDSKRKFLKLEIKETKEMSADEVGLTYEVSYLDPGRGNQAKVTHRKLAQLKREKTQWMITDVRNIKELIEYQNELSLP